MSRGLLSKVSVSSRCSPSLPFPIQQVQGGGPGPGLHLSSPRGKQGSNCWGHSFNSESLTSGHIQVTSFVPLGLCSKSQHVGCLALLGGLAAFNWCCQCFGVESLLRLKSHSDIQLRPHQWSCCRCGFTPDTGRSHCDDTREFLRF